MQKFFFHLCICVVAMVSVVSSPSFAKNPTPLKVTVEGINADGFIDDKYAFCVIAAQGHTKPGENFNVGIQWQAGPVGTKSYAVIVVDKDVPADFTNANKEGKTLPVSQERRDFYHWVLVDVPTTITAIASGEDSRGQQVKPVGVVPHGLTGINDYSGGENMHGGYDGPCPPWNDERMHHYHFQVYALDVAKLNLTGNLTGPQAMEAIKQHAIAFGEVVGKYTTNPKLAAAR